MKASSTARAHSAGRFAARLLGGAVWLLAAAIGAQSDPEARSEAPATDATVSLPTGVVRLVLEGRPVATVATTLAADGPRFALAPIAGALGVELHVGPLGDSHTLIFDDRHIIVGPGQSVLVTVAPDGRTGRTTLQLAHPPIRDAQGLKLPLDVLEIALGEPLNYHFTWQEDTSVLAVSRPELRFLRGAVNLRNQYQVSLVEIELSEAPRYRVERMPGAIEIRLIGDRLQTPVSRNLAASRWVKDVVVAPDGLRIELAPGAMADEPRLLLRPKPRLVVEVFEGERVSAIASLTPRRPPRRSAGVRTIILDPGHGGAETGAVGPGGTAEADLTLVVARTLRLELERRLPVRVILTRDGDLDVTLDSRTAIANENQADLFISLHFNSSFGAGPRGAETYFLSREASDQLAAAVAAAENATAPGAADSELDLQLILWDLAQSYHLAESQRFANLVQEELNLALGLRNRGVKQAPFTVLMGATMPAVLVELGFLSNPEEEEKLQSPLYRAELVNALSQAVTRFKRQVEEGNLAEGGAEGVSGDVPGAAGGKGLP